MKSKSWFHNAVLGLAGMAVAAIFTTGRMGIRSVFADTTSLKMQAEPFFPGGTYLESVPSPEAAFGFPIGTRPLRYQEVHEYLNRLSLTSPRVKLEPIGTSHEDRMLYYVVIGSEKHMARLDQIRESTGRLADPRTLSNNRQAGDLIEKTPAVCWLGYGIHGDELSSTDCAVQLAYQLAAGTDTLTERLLQELIVLINPMQNPDGRERFLAQMEQLQGAVPNPDHQSLQHGGMWPWGRGNHYLFDLNRDWFVLEQPETRSQVRAILDWHPQLLVDSHEMGPLSTYLFSPPREPFNPNITERSKKWWKVFSRDQAQAFDRFGWSYYTAEWNEEWYPGYANSWILYTGAVGILYEQAGVDGSLVTQQDGSLLTFREAVHHHFVSSMANLTTAADHRRELLKDMYEEKARAIRAQPAGTAQAFLFDPGQQKMRTDDFIEKLLLQQIEVHLAEDDFVVRDLHDIWGNRQAERRFPAGTYIVPLNQPMRHLILAILEFDPRMNDSFVTRERRNLEKKAENTIYDVTAWSLPLAYDLQAFWTDKTVDVRSRLVNEIHRAEGSLAAADPRHGWIIDWREDGAVQALIALFQEGCSVHAALDTFAVDGRFFSKGSLLIKRRGNPQNIEQLLQRVADLTGVTILGANTALSEQGPDLGGERFNLLDPPRIAIFTCTPISLNSYGALWHLLDKELGLRFSSLDIRTVAWTDLDKYNVLVLPDTWGGAGAYRETIGPQGIAKLKSWMDGGGTLVAIGSASAFAADSSTGLSSVRLRRQVLDKLDEYDRAVAAEKTARAARIDSLSLWEPKAGQPKGEKKKTEEPSSDQKLAGKRLIEEDEFQRRFMPMGCILRADLDTGHWLTSGMRDRVPVLFFSDYAFLSKHPVETAGRFAEGENLRLSGLLWPEARSRWASTAYLTRESRGKGQIILFADDPVFRGYFRGSERLLLNALLLGPGCGASRSTPW